MFFFQVFMAMFVKKDEENKIKLFSFVFFLLKKKCNSIFINTDKRPF